MRKAIFALAVWLVGCTVCSNGYAAPSLLIAPFLSGEYFCDDAVNNTAVKNENDAATFCAAEDRNGADRVNAALNAIGPAVSPSGKFQLGYTLNVPLFRYFINTNGKWVFDEASLARNLTIINDVARPVVIYLSSNHFIDANQTMALSLARNQQNLMWKHDGVMAPGQYFIVPSIAWTLADQTAPINTMRDAAFRGALEAICKLPAASRARIKAISVLGETHELFPDFEDGPSFSVPMQNATDYSPVAVRGFRTWLGQKYGTIGHLNHDLGAHYASFDAIDPPSKDIRTEHLSTYFDELDPYAAGSVAIYGWIYDRLGRDLTVTVYLDGALVGTAETGLNRTDVTSAVPSIKNPNVGFRLNLDYRDIAYGIHTLEVRVGAGSQTPLSLAKQSLVIVDRNQDPARPIPDAGGNVAAIGTDVNLSGHLDNPAPLQSLFYNPLAQLWLQYRNQVVRSYIEHYARIAGSFCIPESKIFSHQITPALYGSWNPDLLAADASKLPDALYNQGTTLYGGAAFGNAFLTMKRQLGWTRYSVNEMHPGVALTPAQYQAMFEMHRMNGAVYVAPYFVSIIPARLPAVGTLAQFRIAPDNQLDGSDLYWQAIRNAMKQ